MQNQELVGAITEEVKNNHSTTPMAKMSAIFRAVSMMFQKGLRLDTQTVVDSALYVWDTVLVPYDVPYVPPLIEKKLEGRLRAMLEQAIRMLVHQFPQDVTKPDPFGNVMGAAPPPGTELPPAPPEPEEESDG